uniref:Uncharacterized protein n=1 Tax=Timema monikensis TaxID=170555 RepID=A0A7R9EIX7_9NEOP|nr:unnamed protein product [Timema monikensis]
MKNLESFRILLARSRRVIRESRRESWRKFISTLTISTPTTKWDDDVHHGIFAESESSDEFPVGIEFDRVFRIPQISFWFRFGTIYRATPEFTLYPLYYNTAYKEELLHRYVKKKNRPWSMGGQIYRCTDQDVEPVIFKYHELTSTSPYDLGIAMNLVGDNLWSMNPVAAKASPKCWSSLNQGDFLQNSQVYGCT